MSKFGDPNFEFHATNARIGAAALLRLANAEILPYDYVEYARTMKRFASQVGQTMSDKHWKLSAAELSGAIGRMESTAVAFSAARDHALATQLSPTTAKQVNTTLLGVERQLTRARGLVTRPWFRNLIYAADENNGYSTMVLPSVNEAIRLGDEAATARELTDIVQRFDAATRALQVATGLLQRN
jgi:N-acetylated-alpha-linked acidic dipeptidase